MRNSKQQQQATTPAPLPLPQPQPQPQPVTKDGDDDDNEAVTQQPPKNNGNEKTAVWRAGLKVRWMQAGTFLGFQSANSGILERDGERGYAAAASATQQRRGALCLKQGTTRNPVWAYEFVFCTQHTHTQNHTHAGRTRHPANRHRPACPLTPPGPPPAAACCPKTQR